VTIALALCLIMLSDSEAACVAIALALCLITLSDSEAACVAIALAMCLKRKKIAAGPKNGTDEDIKTDLKLS
jgi:hypothetical protein